MSNLESPDFNPVEQIQPDTATEPQDRQADAAVSDAATLEGQRDKTIRLRMVRVPKGALTLHPPDGATDDETLDEASKPTPREGDEQQAPASVNDERVDDRPAGGESADDKAAKTELTGAGTETSDEVEAEQQSDTSTERPYKYKVLVRSKPESPEPEEDGDGRYYCRGTISGISGVYTDYQLEQDGPIRVKLYASPDLKLIKSPFDDVAEEGDTEPQEDATFLGKLKRLFKDPEAEGDEDDRADANAKEKKDPKEVEETAPPQEGSRPEENQRAETQLVAPPKAEETSERGGEDEGGERPPEATVPPEIEVDAPTAPPPETPPAPDDGIHIPLPFMNGSPVDVAANVAATAEATGRPVGQGPEVDLGAIGDYVQQVSSARNQAVTRYGIESPVTQGLLEQEARANRLFVGELQRGVRDERGTPERTVDEGRKELFRKEDAFLAEARIDPNSQAATTAYEELINAERSHKARASQIADARRPVRVVTSETSGGQAAQHLDRLLTYEPSTKHLATHVDEVTVALTGDPAPLDPTGILVETAVRQALTAVYYDGQYVYPPLEVIRARAWGLIGAGEHNLETLVEARSALNALGESVGAGVNSL